jgi:glycosyltransferase involved in cell wall biosynthesis
MKEGLKLAKGEYICVIDGDGQFPIESISQCYYKIKEGNYDLVKTYRSVRNDGLYRSIISFFYNLLFSMLFGGFKVRDVNSKPKILRKTAYQKMILKSDDWFIDAEIMLNVRALKLSFAEFPVEFLKLEGRTSFVKFQAIWEFIKNLVKYKFQ